MLQQATSVNISVKVIEGLCQKFDIEFKEYHKSILTILLPALIYRNGKIIILSETIHQIDRIIKKKNESINFVNILLGWNCITNIDKYGAITIPISFVLNKLTVNREIITKREKSHLSKKVLTNATQTLCVTEVLKYLGVPRMISIPLVNIILEMHYTDLNKEREIMLDTNTAFKGRKMSEISKILKEMQIEKIFLSTAILMVIASTGLKLGTSLILVNVLAELCDVVRAEYKKSTAKGFLKK